ncbi:MAG: J domain-containing protein [Synechococcales cyanobacterium CRU_2_2]|nr:J domain-containing protein [Synechococcales cyanobacterium CRU_2_2]
MPPYDCYTILGITQNATLEDVKQAYRRLARSWHPDRFTDPQEKEVAEEKIKRINAAYEYLKAHPPQKLSGSGGNGSSAIAPLSRRTMPRAMLRVHPVAPVRLARVAPATARHPKHRHLKHHHAKHRRRHLEPMCHLAQRPPGNVLTPGLA